jgi:hypothetical protein
MVMTSVVGICNIALSHVGKTTISDINEESEEARQCKLHYALTRDTMLQAYPWLFARKMQVLAEVTNTWGERWQHTFTRPSDCLKPIRIVPEIDIADDNNGIAYSVGEGLIYCDISPAKLEFTMRFEDPTRFPPLFQDALSWALATKIAMPLTKDQGVRKDAYQIAGQTLGAAQMADANEANDESSTYDRPSALIQSRR